MKFSQYKFLILSDLYRYTETVKIGDLILNIMKFSSFAYIFWMRTCTYTKSNSLLKYSIYPFARLLLSYLKYRLAIGISPSTKIGSGFYIGHFSGIFVNYKSIIGKNCNISQGVTIAEASRGKNKGFPILGNNLYIGPGAKIIGAIKIGDNVAIGANCVVTKDIPNNSVVVGIPGKVISDKGSLDYIIRTDYEYKISQQYND